MALVATFARTPDQAQSWQSMVALVLGMLGGTFFPVAQAGGLLAALSLATPQAWFLRGIENLAGGAGRERRARTGGGDPRVRAHHRWARLHPREPAGGAMKMIAIAGADTRRLLRWRANVFFLFVLPMLIILLLGAAFGGGATSRLGIVQHDHGPLARQFVAALRARPSTTLVTLRAGERSPARRLGRHGRCRHRRSAELRRPDLARPRQPRSRTSAARTRSPSSSARRCSPLPRARARRLLRPRHSRVRRAMPFDAGAGARHRRCRRHPARRRTAHGAERRRLQHRVRDALIRARAPSWCCSCFSTRSTAPCG